jgi:hypothetical protein
VSETFKAAAARWRALRQDYEDYRLAAYARAEHELNGRLLNERGARAAVDALSLFMGPEVRARAYASEELIEHWRRFPRVTFASFERQMLEAEAWVA